MIYINLLPWRDEERRERLQQFAAMCVGGAIAGALLVLTGFIIVGSLVESQEGRNRYLESQVKIVKDQIKQIDNIKSEKRNLLERMQVITDLQTNRPEIVYLFTELVTTIPDGVRLDSLEQRGAIITLRGSSESNVMVSEYIRNFQKSPWFANPALEYIKRDSNKENSGGQFVLRIEQVKPSAEEVSK